MFMGRYNNISACEYDWFKYDLHRSATHPMFDLSGVRTNELQITEIVDNTFYVPETSV